LIPLTLLSLQQPPDRRGSGLGPSLAVACTTGKQLQCKATSHTTKHVDGYTHTKHAALLLLLLLSLAPSAHERVYNSHLTGLFLGWAHTQLLPTPARLTNIIRVSTAISNTGNLPLVMVMSFVKNPNLPFNTASEAELAISYVMLGWFYATMVQMPLGERAMGRERISV
jgi:hypothetical protein